MNTYHSLQAALITLLAIGLMAWAPIDNPSSDEVADQTIEIVGTDNLRFDVTEIEASPGETVRIVLTTESALPPQSMAHNVAVVKPGIDMQAFINASAQAPEHDYVAPGYGDEVIAYTDMVGGGETTEVTFTVPEEPGEYPYVCTFPGHYSGGMVGTLVVR